MVASGRLPWAVAALATAFTIASAPAAVLATPLVQGPTHAQPRIIDGEDAEHNPGAVSIGLRAGKHNCSGALVAPRWVLTARHCAQGDGSYEVHVDALAWREAEKRSVEQVEVSRRADLALFLLNHPVEGTPVLPLGDWTPDEGDEGTAWGWGATSINGGASDVLRVAKLEVRNTSVRDAYGGRSLRLGNITGLPWKGDSGGPFLVEGHVVGIASMSDPSANTCTYTLVPEFLEWIRDTMAEHDGDQVPDPTPSPTPTGTPTSAPSPAPSPTATTEPAPTPTAQPTDPADQPTDPTRPVPSPPSHPPRSAHLRSCFFQRRSRTLSDAGRG